MKNSTVKIVICFVWLFGICVISLTQKSPVVNGKNIEPEAIIPKPDLNEVEKFNSLIQNRFLTEPGFGGARI